MSVLTVIGGTSVGLVDKARVASQVQWPARVMCDAVGDGLPSRSVPVQVTVLELHARAIGCLGSEPHLDLADVVRLVFDLPRRADVPAENHSLWWFVDQ